MGQTYTEEQALVFFDGPQAAQEAGHHNDGAYGDDQVGGRQRRETRGEGGKVALGHGEPDAHTQQPTATELERKKRETFPLVAANLATVSEAFWGFILDPLRLSLESGVLRLYPEPRKPTRVRNTESCCEGRDGTHKVDRVGPGRKSPRNA